VVSSDRTSLVGLRAKLGARLDELWTRLEREAGFERLRKALVIYFDERVMNSLPEYLRLSWPLLQTDFTGSTAGGEDFYRFIEAALDDPKTPSLVFEVHYFCLRHGFKGKHTNALATIAAIERRLVARIELPPPSPANERALADADEHTRGEPWPVWVYYALAGLFVVGSCVTLTMLSNRGSAADSRVNEATRRSP
jgi:type IV/VI secretion system ImpK/VasF family protein